jgi:hypothetical protein
LFVSIFANCITNYYYISRFSRTFIHDEDLGNNISLELNDRKDELTITNKTEKNTYKYTDISLDTYVGEFLIQKIPPKNSGVLFCIKKTTPGFEPGMKVLQTFALPLGYAVTVKRSGNLRSVLLDSNQESRICRPLPFLFGYTAPSPTPFEVVIYGVVLVGYLIR